MIERKKNIVNKKPQKGVNNRKNIKIEEDVEYRETKGINKKAKNKRKSKFSKIIKIILAIILILLIIFGFLVGHRIKSNGGGMQGIVATILGHDASTLQNLEELRFVVIGQSQTLTDTIMICSYNPRTQKAAIMSIPRDTFTGNNKSSATAYNKINVLYQESPEKLLEKLNALTGLDLKYYIHVDTEALRSLVDAIGGVEFDVPIDMKYDDPTQKLHINLKKGYQLLDGNKAEQLVRFRHNNNGTTYPSSYGQEDIGRMKTQREFLKAVVVKMAKAENLTKIDDYISIAKKYVNTNMDFDALKDYAPYAISFNIANVRTETLPGAPEKINSIWFYSCDRTKTRALVKEMFELELSGEEVVEEISEKPSKSLGIKVEILDGINNSAKLKNVETKLKNAGFTVSKTGKTTDTAKTAIINRKNASSDIIDKIKNTVGAGTISNGNDNAGVDFTIIIGNDMQ